MSSSEYSLYNKLLKKGFSEEELEKEMQRKAKEFGGFMSERGILFIIAKENGINVQSPEIDTEGYMEYQELLDEIDYNEFTINISELEEGMQNIVLIGKILEIYKPKEFVRKDSSIGQVGSFYIADTSGKIKIVLWNEKTKFMNNEYFKIDQLIRIIGGFCRKNREGLLEVHLGRKSEIIISPQDIPCQTKKKLLNLANLEQETKERIKNDMQIFDLVSKYTYIKRIQGMIEIENFREMTKKDGSKTFLLKCLLSDSSMSIRLVIWGMHAVKILKLINNGDYAAFQNLIVKENSYTNEKELIYTRNSSLEII